MVERYRGEPCALQRRAQVAAGERALSYRIGHGLFDLAHTVEELELGQQFDGAIGCGNRPPVRAPTSSAVSFDHYGLHLDPICVTGRRGVPVTGVDDELAAGCEHRAEGSEHFGHLGERCEVGDRGPHAQERIETPRFQMCWEIPPGAVDESGCRVETGDRNPLLGDGEHFGTCIAADDVEPAARKRDDIDADPARRVEDAGTGVESSNREAYTGCVTSETQPRVVVKPVVVLSE